MAHAELGPCSVPTAIAGPVEDRVALLGLEAEAQVVRRDALAQRRHHLGEPANSGSGDLDEHGVLDAIELGHG